MGHAHSHGDDRSSYYLDQLFNIGVCGAIAAVTLILWMPLTGSVSAKVFQDVQSTFVQVPKPENQLPSMLNGILHLKFHLWVLVGGLSLIALVLVRGIAVWRSVDQTAEHEHGPDCDHGHGHEHGPGCDHGHSHGHGHSHAHAEQHAPVGLPPGGMTLALAGGPAAPAAPTHAHSHGDHEHGWAPWRYVVLLLPVVLYFLVLSNPAFDTQPIMNPRTPLEQVHNFIGNFRSIVWEAMPFIILGAVIAGLLEELLPQSVVTAVLPRNRFQAIAVGGLLGLVFPMCECGIIPIMRRLLRKGLPLSCCVAYLLAGPIVNVVVILSTVAAFSGMENALEGGKPSYQMGGLWMTVFRVGLGYLIAVVTSLLVEWQHKKHGDALLTPLTRPSKLPLVEEEGAAATPKPVWQRVSNISETALHDFADITVFLILGALIASTVRIFLTPDHLAMLSRDYIVLSILVMMALAVILCLCSEADAFVAASFVTLRPSAKLAFLVLGPMLDFKLYFMYTRIFRPRLILTIYASIISLCFACSLGVHYWWEKVIVPASQEAMKQEEDMKKGVEAAPRQWWFVPQWMLIRPTLTQTPTVSPAEFKATASKALQTVGLLQPSGPGALHPIGALAAAGMLMVNPSEQIEEISFLQLENASATAELRHFYEGRRVRLMGQFRETTHGFTLVRYKINCCVADATPLRAAMVVYPEQALPVKELRGQWVRVTGRVRFQRGGDGTYHTGLFITPNEREPLSKLIEIVPADANPYVY